MSSASVRKDDPDPEPSLRADPPFRRILIANRGEIAIRVLRTCRDLGMQAVTVFSDIDAGAPWVREADAAVRLGPAPAAQSYLRGDAIVRAALDTGAEAIHPGYGFLSERAAFAAAVASAGLVFVGPPADAIAALGDKLAARRTASAAGVPVVPGSMEPLPADAPSDVDQVVRLADEIGFPLLVKAAAGGGGRGMRRVEDRRELVAALAAGAAEAASAFGDGRVYLERELRPARHIEVQLLGDATGEVVAIGERDCSIQRRHQKLVEEAPAPGLGPDERRTLFELAVKAATAAGLRNAATAEFLRDADGRFWFLEVNARLQVEHGVTELVTGLDLVREQFLLAAGRRLSPEVRAAARAAVRPVRHAIEVRLSAEDPARAFVPVPGTIGHWRMPSGPGVRVDTAIAAGDRVPPDYDPLIAKVMADGEDRQRAIARLARGLAEIEVSGIQTTLPFHLALVRDGHFLGAELSTDFVAEHWDGPVRQAAARADAVVAAARHAAAGRSRSRAPGRWTVSVRKDAADSSAWKDAALAESTDRWPEPPPP